MKRTICIGLTAALAFACGGKHDDRVAQSGSGAPPGSSANAGAPNQSEQAVVLIGCLQGDGTAGSAVGTSGTATGADSRGVRDRFILTSATPDSHAQNATPAGTSGSIGAPAGANASTGSGSAANGAGASGGPVVSGVSSYTLVGNSSDLSGHVNHQVRITGRMNTATTAYDTPARTATASGSANGTPAANSGSAGSGVGAGSASGMPGPNAATNSQSGVGMRTVTVDSVEMVSSNCSNR